MLEGIWIRIRSFEKPVKYLDPDPQMLYDGISSRHDEAPNPLKNMVNYCNIQGVLSSRCHRIVTLRRVNTITSKTKIELFKAVVHNIR